MVTEEIIEARRIKFDNITKASESPEISFEDKIFIFFTESSCSFLFLEISEIEFEVKIFFGFVNDMEQLKHRENNQDGSQGEKEICTNNFSSISIFCIENINKVLEISLRRYKMESPIKRLRYLHYNGQRFCKHKPFSQDLDCRRQN